jgi:hypothetical protein
VVLGVLAVEGVLLAQAAAQVLLQVVQPHNLLIREPLAAAQDIILLEMLL